MVTQMVAHRAMDREVPSLNPTGSWAFFFSIFPTSINQWCILKQVSRGGATLLIFNFPTKMKAAWGKASLICTEWAKTRVGLPHLLPITDDIPLLGVVKTPEQLGPVRGQVHLEQDFVEASLELGLFRDRSPGSSGSDRAGAPQRPDGLHFSGTSRGQPVMGRPRGLISHQDGDGRRVFRWRPKRVDTIC